MTGALPIVKQGGTIILAASLSEGIGSPQFEQLFREHASLEILVERILGKDYFMIDQMQRVDLAKIRLRAKGNMVASGLATKVHSCRIGDPSPRAHDCVAATWDAQGRIATSG